ncbi:SUMF1/EgtB/PvdO family nonheme iron enzyme [Veronia nyctiphanis]|uniref:SUMF1/EgtB/PvdO family nonheme iron enzyme n=1 Tax=Veronia nyctiphanis TaxID=1278244 RepID=UPI001F19243D|nr:SUMF1/EgtB/PvdO family nonheme iron enzyme [Veronia nyctiphanis]
MSLSVFDQPHPYDSTPGGYEWYRQASGNKIRHTGSKELKPNPLGLYDMLGNAEELTYGIFGHDFLFARFGGLVVRGGNFSDHIDDIKASRRAEYKVYKSNGDILRWSKVGFRLAIGTLVSESGHTNDELDDAYEDYIQSDSGVTQSGPVGKTSLSQQAQADQVNYYSDEISRLSDEVKELRGDNKNLVYEAETLHGKIEENLLTLAVLKRELNAEREKNKNLSKLADIESIDKKINIAISVKDSEISRLKSELTQLSSLVAKQVNQLKSKELSDKKIFSLQKKVSDAERRDTIALHEIEKNKKRIIVAEKRLLEALVRVAGYNLYTAWRNLRAIEIKKRAGSSVSPSAWDNNKREAEAMLKEYRRYIVQIIDNTNVKLLPEVKNKVVNWLESNKIDKRQIQGLDLLERHIREVQQGKYLQVDELYDSLLSEPELK